MKQIGVAVAGTGFIGPVHVEALKRVGVTVTGILGSSAAKSQAAAEVLGLPVGYASYEALLDDEAVDAVHLAVPNRLHYNMAQRALVRGKHVMCEKPLAMNAHESAQLVMLAAESGLQAGVCYNVRFYPLNLEVRNMVRGGALGEVYSIAGSYVQDWLLYETDYNWRVLADQGGAPRAVADIGTHWIDLVCTIAGLEVEAVFADLKTVHPVRQRPRGEVETFTGKLDAASKTEPVAIETEDCGAVLFRFAGGARGTLWVSQTTAGRKNCLRYEIAGAERALACSASLCWLSWWAQRGLSRHVQGLLPRLLPVRRRPGAPGHVSYLRGRAPRDRALRGDPEKPPRGAVGGVIGAGLANQPGARAWGEGNACPRLLSCLRVVNKGGVQ